MSVNPTHRPDMTAVVNHPWMQGKTANDQEIKEEFKVRKADVDAAVDAEKSERREARRNEKDARRVARGDGDNQELEQLFSDLNIAESNVDQE